MKRRSVFLLLLPVLCAAAPQTSPGRIQGVVLHGDTDQPVPDATAVLGAADLSTAEGTQPDPVTTDNRGRFSFATVESGNYRLGASRNGYIRQVVGSRDAPLKLQAGQQLDGIIVRLIPAATITGRVLDELGQPLGDVPVWLYESTGEVETTTRTNDRGEYRFFYLSPGQYWIAAGQTTGQTLRTPGTRSSQAVTRFPEVFDLTYHPGVRDLASSRPADVKAGEEASEVNIMMGASSPPAPRPRPAAVPAGVEGASQAPQAAPSGR
jgi:hypothetical protein